jgi:glycolate oxidase FAD binding subunit
VFELSADQAVQSVNEWGGQPLPLSATCYYQGRLYARFSGAASAVDAAVRRLGGWPMQDGESFWTSVREQTHEFFSRGEPETRLWRVSVQSTAPYADLGGEQLVEWGGGLRWLRAAMKPVNGARAHAEATRLRTWAGQHGGHATLFRSADKSVGVFQSLGAPLLELQRRLKAVFDPAGIFNPGRLYPGF